MTRPETHATAAVQKPDVWVRDKQQWWQVGLPAFFCLAPETQSNDAAGNPGTYATATQRSCLQPFSAVSHPAPSVEIVLFPSRPPHAPMFLGPLGELERLGLPVSMRGYTQNFVTSEHWQHLPLKLMLTLCFSYHIGVPSHLHLPGDLLARVPSASLHKAQGELNCELATNENTQMLQKALELWRQPNAVDWDGLYSSLWYAVTKDNLDAARVLLDAGANPLLGEATDDLAHRQSAWARAHQIGNPEMMALLQKFIRRAEE